LGDGCAIFLDFDEAVFGVVDQGEGVSADDARGLIAVGVVLICITARAGDGMHGTVIVQGSVCFAVHFCHNLVVHQTPKSGIYLTGLNQP